MTIYDMTHIPTVNSDDEDDDESECIIAKYLIAYYAYKLCYVGMSSPSQVSCIITAGINIFKAVVIVYHF